ncbi:hypothetical protein pipiens_008539 [Culex pipiens pipiens]|uniref:CRAL-TRIO domain-containing protein n=1 Tax=Culex pipiens pipiens TaxID=38569 RepID=A0ABD1DH13_CULPP
MVSGVIRSSGTTETYCPDAIGHVLATHIGKRTRILDGSFTYVELMKHYSSSLDDPDWQKENLPAPDRHHAGSDREGRPRVSPISTALTGANSCPSLQWLKDVYSILPYKYKKNLKAFYIVHPTFWTKMMTWWFTTFMAPAIKTKVHSLPGVEHLYSAIAKDQLEIPAYITEYDMATNGIHYFQPVTNTSSPAS